MKISTLDERSVALILIYIYENLSDRISGSKSSNL